MNRKIIRLFIAVLLILAAMIMSGCAAPTPKLNISIKIEATASTWREGKQPYDIYGAVKQKLEKVGFDVVPQESTDYNAILFLDYEEAQGDPYTWGYGGSPTGDCGTNITCHLRLDDKAQNTMFKTKIFATTPSLVTSGTLYSSALDDFKDKAFFKYLGEFISEIIASKSAVGDEVSVLIRALGDEDESVRWKAAEALGQTGDARAVEPLIQALKDESWLVRSAAEKALEKIRGE